MFLALEKFAKDRKGTVAVTVSIVLIPFMGILGAAIDYNAAERAKTELQNLVDASGLMALNKSSTSEAIIVINAYLADTKFAGATISGVAITNTASGRTLTLTATATVPTLVLGHALGGGSEMPIVVTSKISGTFKPISYTFTPLQASGWYAKDIFIWVKDGNGNLISLTKTLSYDFNWANLGINFDGNTTPPLNTATTSFSLPATHKTGVMMRVYPTGTACGQTRATCTPTDYYSDASNSNLFLQRSSSSCADVGGQNNNWEDGGDNTYTDFVYALRCTVSSTDLINTRIDR